MKKHMIGPIKFTIFALVATFCLNMVNLKLTITHKTPDKIVLSSHFDGEVRHHTPHGVRIFNGY